MAADKGEDLNQFLAWMKSSLLELMSPSMPPKAVDLVNNLEVKDEDGRSVLMFRLYDAWETNRWDEAKSRLVKNFFHRLPLDPKGRRLSDLVKKPRSAEFEPTWKDVPPLLLAGELSYDNLTNHLRHLKEIKKVTLIQHHGGASEGLRGYLHGRDAEIELFIQAPEKTCCSRQRRKVSSFLESLFNMQRGLMANDNATDRLKVYVYDTPASLRAVLVDEQVAAAGWYMYHPDPEKDTGVDMWGNQLPSIYAEAGSEAYRYLAWLIQKWLDAHKQFCTQVYPPTNKIRAWIKSLEEGAHERQPAKSRLQLKINRNSLPKKLKNKSVSSAIRRSATPRRR
jgi:hypothetical protein